MALGFYSGGTTGGTNGTAIGTVGNPFDFATLGTLNSAISCHMRCTDYGADDIQFADNANLEVSFDGGSTWYDFSSEPASNVQGVNVAVQIRQKSYAAAASETFTTNGIFDTVISASTPLGQVVGLTATASASTAGAIDLSWTALANRTYYKIRRATNLGMSTNLTTLTSTATATTYSDTGRTVGTTYYYDVQGIGDGVSYTDGAVSSVASAVANFVRSTSGVLFADNFNFSDTTAGTSITENSATAWEIVTGEQSTGNTIQISSNKLRWSRPSVGPTVQRRIQCTGAGSVGNQVIQMRIPSAASEMNVGIGARYTVPSGALNGYYLNAVQSGADAGTYVWKWAAGAYTNFYTGAAPTANDLFTIAAVGTTITAWKNGTQLDSRTDSAVSTGYPAILVQDISGDTTATFDLDNFVSMKHYNVTVTNLPSGWYVMAYDGTNYVKSAVGSGSGTTTLDCHTLDFTQSNAAGIALYVHNGDPGTTYNNAGTVQSSLTKTGVYGGDAWTF